MSLSNRYDLLVIGGGINGAGIACDAARRGLKVMLCEADDFASATSSASSKLIHGGLRYLEQCEFRLVREALAEDAVSRLRDLFPGMGPKWTETAKLPGGEFGATNFDNFVAALGNTYPELPASLIWGLVRRHGSLTQDVLGDATTEGHLGRKIGHNVYEREAHYLKRHEWAKRPNDILWRRTKAGLHLDAQGLATAKSTLEAIL